jgi:hypothetical protein
MIEKQNKQYQNNSSDDSTAVVQENNLVLLKHRPTKNIDESINTPERYVSWYQTRSNNLDKYLEICPHCKKPTMYAFHRTVINSAVDYLEGKRMFASYNPDLKTSFPVISFILAIGTGLYFLLNHIVNLVKG